MVDVNLNQSLNMSMKTLICNHCSFEFANYLEMKEHYKSQFHLYNLHRVTNNLNPVTFQVFTEKKENCIYKFIILIICFLNLF